MQSRIALAANYLKAGGVLAYPTEGVWGLGCDPMDRDAVRKILTLKQRDWRKGLILIAANIDQLRPYIASLNKEQEAQLCAGSERAQTWIVPASERVHPLLRGQHSKIAVRISQHNVVRELCLAFGGAIVSTSANPGGMPAASNRVKVMKYFGGSIDCYAPGNIGGANGPSQIKDLISGEIIRP
jgi:L-threonylcarbamoyladenylate synthase